MKKFFVSTLATLVLTLVAVGSAQADASHDLDVVIPAVLMIQIVDGAGAVVDFPFVEFAVDVNDYLFVAEGTPNTFNPTDSNFTDVQVLSNYATWSVGVTAPTFLFTPAVAASGAIAAGLDLGDITVVDGAAGFALNTTLAIASGSVATDGWESLGFGGDSFRLLLDGDEEPGTYSWTIEYTLTAP